MWMCQHNFQTFNSSRVTFVFRNHKKMRDLTHTYQLFNTVLCAQPFKCSTCSKLCFVQVAFVSLFILLGAFSCCSECRGLHDSKYSNIYTFTWNTSVFPVYFYLCVHSVENIIVKVVKHICMCFTSNNACILIKIHHCLVFHSFHYYLFVCLCMCTVKFHIFIFSNYTARLPFGRTTTCKVATKTQLYNKYWEILFQKVASGY